MKVILAEKPSVGRDLAAFLGASNSRQGYLTGNGYQITWAFGHLVGLQEPGDYDPALKAWRLDYLPFVPPRFQLKVIGDKRARQQFNIVRQLFQGADEIICATDAGREGELIFRYILQLSGAERKPVQRLWLNSLTPASIRQAFQELKPSQAYDRLFEAARCRSEADWIVGLNATRCYTVLNKEQGVLWSVGRVQTPILALIVERDDDIRTFRPESFKELITTYRETQFICDDGRFFDPAKAQEALARVIGQPFRIDQIKTREQVLQPPRLYDLTDLQRDMNRRYGLSAAMTLKAAQALYEKKAITYPRTDSQYLTRDLHGPVRKTLEKLRALKPQEIDKLDLTRLPQSRNVFNDSKVSDHHAIIPTGSKASPSGNEAKVYEAIVTRLIAAFYPPCRKEHTTVHGASAELGFTAKGVRLLVPGWTELYPRPKTGKEDEQIMPRFERGESGPHEPSLRDGETKPPPHFTENSLLALMETAGKLVDDDELKEALKEHGLGTPATRASIIETLLKRGYLERQGKQLLATDAGRYLIATIRDPLLKSAEMTGDWEAKLHRVQRGEQPASRFMAEVCDYTNQLIAAAQQTGVDPAHYGTCPRCAKPVIKGKRGFGCSGWREGCTFVIWPQYEDIQLSEQQIRRLLQHGLLSTPCTLHGKPSILYLSHHGHVLHVDVPTRPSRSGKPYPGKKQSRRGSGKPPDDASLGTCPQCGKMVREEKKSYSCEAWRDGCPFTIWKTMAGKRITSRTAKALLKTGQSSRLKGFKSKAGNSFDAALRLEDGKVVFDFGNQGGHASS